MRISSIMRRDFPRGWWRSGSWWSMGLRGVLASCMVAMFTALFVRRVRRMIAHRDQPRRLAGLLGRAEGWAMAVLLGLVYFSLLVVLVVDGGGLPGPLVPLGVVALLWSTSNVVVGGTALGVLVRSRIRDRQEWADIDFVEEHAPRHGRPPETVEEYRALRMKVDQERDAQGRR